MRIKPVLTLKLNWKLVDESYNWASQVQKFKTLIDATKNAIASEKKFQIIPLISAENK